MRHHRFTTVEGALAFFYRERAKMASARAIPLKAREIEEAPRTDRLEAKMAAIMDVAICTRGLFPVERHVLDRIYGEHESLNQVGAYLARRFPRGARWVDQQGRPRTIRKFYRLLIAGLRVAAELKVEARLRKAGLLA